MLTGLIITHVLSLTATHTLRHTVMQKETLTHNCFPVECVSSMTCFPAQQHLPQASNKTQIKAAGETCHHTLTHTHTHNNIIFAVIMYMFMILCSLESLSFLFVSLILACVDEK